MTTQKTFAVIKNGQVVNLAIAPSGWAPPDLTVVEVPEGARANIGDSANPATWLVLGVTATTLSVPPPTTQDLLNKLDADNTLTQRNLRETIMLMNEAFKLVSSNSVDLSNIPGVAQVYAVEAQAAVLRGQL